MGRRHPPSDLHVSLPLAPDAAAVICEEFILNHPLGPLRRETALAAVSVVVVVLADGLSVFHVMELKNVDAMGNAIGSTAGLVAVSAVTVMGYVTCGVALGLQGRWAKPLAAGVYVVVLVLLFQALAPAEASNVRAVWESLTGGGGFGSGGAMAEVPALFFFGCIGALAVAFSLFGVVLIAAKSWLWRLVGVWRHRSIAQAVLQRRGDELTRTHETSERAAFLATLETPHVTETIVTTVLRQGLAAYSAVLTTQIAALQKELADLRHSRAEKQRLSEHLATAQACLASATTITQESL